MRLCVGSTGRFKVDKVDLSADLENRIYNQKKKRNVPKWLFFGALATCTVAALIFLNKEKAAIIFDGPGGKIVHLLKPYVEPEPVKPIIEYVLPPRPVRPPRPVAVRPEDVTSPTIRQWVPKDEEKQREKQTVFTDDNYQPRGSVNTMIPPPSKYYEKGEARSKAQISEVFRSIAQPVETRTIPWQWKSVKNYRSGTFNYTQRNGKIETHMICRNYKYGSFEYRDCRKAAKKYFKDACSNQFAAACNAAEMIP